MEGILRLLSRGLWNWGVHERPRNGGMKWGPAAATAPVHSHQTKNILTNKTIL
jgi:hypothetical protein